MFQKQCRVCLNKFVNRQNFNFSDVFQKENIVVSNRHKHITYAFAFHECTKIEAQMEELICAECCNQLEMFYEFLCKARESDVVLQQPLIEKNHQTRSKTQYNSTTTYVPALTDDACSSSALKTEFLLNNSRDPLLQSSDEEHEDDNKQGYIFDMANDDKATFKHINNSTSDDDDDKPLLSLLQHVKSEQLHGELLSEQEQHEQKSPFHESCNYLDLESKGQFENENGVLFDEHLHDLSISPESQIFPQGRYKCQICGKAYFTSIGLEAHLEMHFPKIAEKKRRRQRGPNKNTRNRNNTSKLNKPHGKIVPDNSNDEENDAEDASNKFGRAAGGPNNIDGDADESAAVRLQENDTEATIKERKVKPPKPKKMFPCQVCDKHMISASKLRYHMVMHTGEKDFLCTMCPKAYSTIYALKHHMRAHTGERPYECKFCGDKFTRPTTLKSHMRRHTGERPYGCQICGKRFIQHSSMTTHMKLNHMAKTIPCPHCDKKYARQTDLNTHLLSHTGDKPFACQLCSSRFIRQANLNKHMNQHHLQQQQQQLLQNNGNNSCAADVDASNLAPDNIKTKAKRKVLIKNRIAKENTTTALDINKTNNLHNTIDLFKTSNDCTNLLTTTTTTTTALKSSLAAGTAKFFENDTYLCSKQTTKNLLLQQTSTPVATSMHAVNIQCANNNTVTPTTNQLMHTNPIELNRWNCFNS